jgi:hypothetical protein
VQGLEGEADIHVAALEDPRPLSSNYEGYDAYHTIVRKPPTEPLPALLAP